jgi:hypothetical protein
MATVIVGVYQGTENIVFSLFRVMYNERKKGRRKLVRNK